ncbi:hypothetical protein cyc_01769 [Cyclospora cayetanensis]|uniref:Uncharacterized protein n=1 Tax=Cyclospora cayetanensis TaxID=88456 RepID=A0A1D3D124_9EIME|nr:hypothetical protein cyc_01769 [Cyclospora cayetanensis]
MASALLPRLADAEDFSAPLSLIVSSCLGQQPLLLLALLASAAVVAHDALGKSNRREQQQSLAGLSSEVLELLELLGLLSADWAQDSSCEAVNARVRDAREDFVAFATEVLLSPVLPTRPLQQLPLQQLGESPSERAAAYFALLLLLLPEHQQRAVAPLHQLWGPEALLKFLLPLARGVLLRLVSGSPSVDNGRASERRGRKGTARLCAAFRMLQPPIRCPQDLASDD